MSENMFDQALLSPITAALHVLAMQRVSAARGARTGLMQDDANRAIERTSTSAQADTAALPRSSGTTCKATQSPLEKVKKILMQGRKTI